MLDRKTWSPLVGFTPVPAYLDKKYISRYLRVVLLKGTAREREREREKTSLAHPCTSCSIYKSGGAPSPPAGAQECAQYYLHIHVYKNTHYTSTHIHTHTLSLTHSHRHTTHVMWLSADLCLFQECHTPKLSISNGTCILC